MTSINKDLDNKMFVYLMDNGYFDKLEYIDIKKIADKYDKLAKELQPENKWLKDNWNKLEEYLLEQEDRSLDGKISFDDVLIKMQELECQENDIC